MSITRTEVLGVPVDAVDMPTTLDMVREMLNGRATNVIVAVNPEKVITAQRNPDLLRALEQAELVIPDGIGVVAAARLLGKGRMERVPGSDLMPAICEIAAKESYSVFLYGAKPQIVTKAASLLQKRYPGLRIAGTQDGYLPESGTDQLIQRINLSGADILFVGLGSPKQEIWMHRYGAGLNPRICQGVGGTFDAICGHPKRAPKAFQKLHLEWLYRLVSQPRRASRQVALPRFVGQLVRELMFGKNS